MNKDSYSRLLSNKEVSQLTNIPIQNVRKMQQGVINRDRSKYEEYLLLFSPSADGWILNTSLDKVKKYEEPTNSKYYSNSKVSLITGLSVGTLARIKAKTASREKYKEYLINFKFDYKVNKWEKIADFPQVKYEGKTKLTKFDENNTLYTDAELERITKIDWTTLSRIRRGTIKNSSLKKYLINFKPEGDYWLKVDDQEVEEYIRYEIGDTRVSRETGISREQIRKIRLNQLMFAEDFNLYLTNYKVVDNRWEKIDDKELPKWNEIEEEIETSTLLDLFNIYCIIYPDRRKKLLSTLIRYFLVPENLIKISGKRANEKDINQALKCLSEIPKELIKSIDYTVQKSAKSSNTSKGNKYSIKNIISHFKSYFCVKEEKETPKQLAIKEWEEARGIPIGKRGKIKKHGIKRKSPFILCAKNKNGEYLFPEDYINKNLKEQIENFEQYSKKYGLFKKTIEKNTRIIREFLGWLVRYKSYKLEELSLNDIIYYSQLTVNFDSVVEREADNKKAWDEYIYAKAFNREKAMQTAKDNIALIKEFIEYCGNVDRTRVSKMHCFIKIAEFLYNTDVGIFSEDYVDFDCVPIIKKLKLLQKKLYGKAYSSLPAISYTERSESWKTIVEITERLRKLADTEYNPKSRTRRRKSTTSGDLQRFLIFGFLTLLPPDRSRTLWDMEIDKNLIFGFYENNSLVEPNDRNVKKCKWYRFLGKAKDYKTVKIYKEHIIEIPNFEFSDGKKFYEYIDRWIKLDREYGRECNHNYFFRLFTKSEPMNYKNINSVVRNCLHKYGCKPVNIQTFRDIYISWFSSLPDIDLETKESLALLQHHSVKMQQNVYNKNSNYQKSLKGWNFHQEKMSFLFNTIDFN